MHNYFLWTVLIFLKVVPYTSGKIWSVRTFNFLNFLAVCLNISTAINIKILTNSNQQTQSYIFTSHIAAFLSVVLITEMLEICIQTAYDQNVQLILKSYPPIVLGTTLNNVIIIESKVYLLTTKINFTTDFGYPFVVLGSSCSQRPKLLRCPGRYLIKVIPEIRHVHLIRCLIFIAITGSIPLLEEY